MDSARFGEIILDEPLSSLIKIESQISVSISAEHYRALYNRDQSGLNVWLTRGKLADSQRKAFISRIEKFESLNIPSCPISGYGVDSEGLGFVFFPKIEGGPLVPVGASSCDAREAERRFMPCLQIMEKIHSAGMVLSDLGPASFILDRTGRVLFTGVMGLFGEILDHKTASSTQVASAARDLFHYIAPEQRKKLDGATQAADVYSLGVMGYRLFGGKFPYPKATIEELRDPSFIYPLIAPLIPSPRNQIPEWCNDIFIECLKKDPADRLQNAAEISAAIAEFSQHSGRTKKNIVREKPEKPQEIIEESEIQQSRGNYFKKKKIAPFVSLSAGGMIALFAALAAVIAAVMWGIGSFTESSGHIAQSDPAVVADSSDSPSNAELLLLRDACTDQNLKTAVSTLINSQSADDNIRQALQVVAASEDPIAHEILTVSSLLALAERRNIFNRAMLSRLERLGEKRTVSYLRNWLKEKSEISSQEIYELVLKSANPQQPIAAREGLLRRLYMKDQKTALLLAAAIALDAPNLSDYNKIISQIVGDSLNLEDSAQKSVLALLFAQISISESYGEDILLRKQEIPDADLPWLLNILAVRSDNRIREFARLAAERSQLSGARKVFIDVFKDREDLPPEIIHPLVKAATGKSAADIIPFFGAWIDSSSEKVLLALMLEFKDEKLITEAFETLAAKPLSLDFVRELVEIVRNKYWDQRSALAPIIAIASLPGIAGEELVRGYLDKLESYLGDARFIELLVSSQDSVLPRMILERYGEKLGFSVLIKLLSNENREVRIASVKAMKRFNDVGILKFIMAQYDKEKDPEVREIYKQTFWMIAEREAKSKG